MKSVRILLAVAVLASLTGLAYVAQQTESSGSKMVTTAQAFLGTLTADQKAQTVFPFDSKERTDWNFIPLQDSARKTTRKGLPLEAMTVEQKKAALALVKAGTSETGNAAALFIMNLEKILLDQEKMGAMVRNPEWYFFTVFGTPAKTGKWGWRVEGHHLSLNFTMDGTQVLSVTPNFYGADPAEVKAGPNKGKRILAPSEDLALDLFKALNDEQKKDALLTKSFGEPVQKSLSPTMKPVGLAAAKMTEAQRGMLWKLLTSYTDRMPADQAETELKLVKDAGLEKVMFAFTIEPGKKGHTYRVQGPTFVIEFLNTQADSAGNPANHIHSCWRRIKGDFGLGL